MIEISLKFPYEVPRVSRLPAVPRVGEYIEYGPSTVGKVTAVRYQCHSEVIVVHLSNVPLAWYREEIK